MNPWAMFPVVISIGATDSENGEKLESYSSGGNASKGESGPTLVTFGKSVLPPFPLGTCLAATRVSGLLTIFTAFSLTLDYFIQKCNGRRQEGIPLVGFGVIDIDIARLKGKLRLSTLPTEGFNVELLSEVLTSALDWGYEVQDA